MRSVVHSRLIRAAIYGAFADKGIRGLPALFVVIILTYLYPRHLRPQSVKAAVNRHVA
jgi:hypothetical protein